MIRFCEIFGREFFTNEQWLVIKEAEQALQP